MELRKINGFTFVNETEGTRNGFRHISHLFNDLSGAEIASGKVNYLNRTWESYRYQTSMSKAVGEAIADRAETLKYIVKNDRNLTRLDKQAKEDLAKMLNEDEYLKELYDLASAI